MIDAVNAPSLQTGTSITGKKPQSIAEAATQFESLLIAQLLKTARESGTGEGWLGTGDDATADSALQLAEEQFASMLAKQGGLGLARMVQKGLAAAE